MKSRRGKVRAKGKDADERSDGSAVGIDGGAVGIDGGTVGIDDDGVEAGGGDEGTVAVATLNRAVNVKDTMGDGKEKVEVGIEVAAAKRDGGGARSGGLGGGSAHRVAPLPEKECRAEWAERRRRGCRTPQSFQRAPRARKDASCTMSIIYKSARSL